METLNVPRILFSGTSKSVGKSLFTIGLVTVLKQRGLGVSACTVGSNLHNSSILKRICSRNVHSIDTELLSDEQILTSLYMSSLGAEVVVLEGYQSLVMQSQAEAFLGSMDAFTASLAEIPVALLFDGSMPNEEIVQIIRSNIDSYPQLEIGASIANRIPADEKSLLTKIAEINSAFSVNDISPLLGVLPEIPDVEPLPSYPINEFESSHLLSRQFLVELSSIVANCVDVDAIVEYASKANPIDLDFLDYEPDSIHCKIAVADDSAFNLGFQDNLSYLRYYGAELKSFSPLADRSLPKGIGGLYLTGGFLAEYADDLSRNREMILAIRDFYEKGGVIYSEGAGTAYLCREFSTPKTNKKYGGVGIIPASAEAGRPDFHYFKATTMEDSIIGRSEQKLTGISSGDWHVVRPDKMIRVLRILRQGEGALHEGFSPGAEIFSTFAFLHWGSCPEIAKSFVYAASGASV